MAQLVVIACLLAAPDQCTEKVVPGVTAPNVVKCLTTAGDKALEWQKSNSEYRVIAWRCELKK